MTDDHITISTYQFLKRFPNAEAARLYMEARRWPKGAICPACGCVERIQPCKRAGILGYYRCLSCEAVFTVRTGTIFERSHVPLDKWLYAMYLMATARKGISSTQLSKELGVTQKTAWFMLQRLREACGNDKDDDDAISDKRCKVIEVLEIDGNAVVIPNRKWAAREIGKIKNLSTCEVLE